MPDDTTKNHNHPPSVSPGDSIADRVRRNPGGSVLRDVLTYTAQAALLGAVAGAGVAAVPQTANAQADFTERPGTNNPLDGVDVGDNSTPQFFDYESDGDLDIAIGRADGTIAFFENTGSATSPNYVEQTGSSNPFDGEDVGDNAAIDFGDIDGDGDLDIVAGKNAGALLYIENTGSATSPNYVSQSGTDNPFNGIGVGTNSAPKLADFDGDGDLDVVVGRADGTLAYVENTGSASSPNYVQQTGASNPFDGFDAGDDSIPGLADIDGDGDLDLAVGKNESTVSNSITYFENVGSASDPDYQQRTASDNPFDGFAGTDSAPVFGDVDGDGDVDAAVGAADGQIRYLENTGDVTRSESFVEAENNPLSGQSLTDGNSAPAVADLDADGDLDIVAGKGDGTLVYFKNTGSATNPSYSQEFGVLPGNDYGEDSAPLVVDFDADGDYDIAVGQGDGNVSYLENTGSVTSPSFTQRTGSSNPFNSIALLDKSKLTTADIDADGDLDIVAGKGGTDSSLLYFENDGSRTSPNYVDATDGSAFDGLTATDGAPEFDDVDNDGDYDLTVGTGSGAVKYFENTGTKTNPSFSERTGTDNPFAGATQNGQTAPRFADLDGDGDRDLVLGQDDGSFDVYRYGDSDVLPVELTNFAIQPDGNAAMLTWSTASEKNNSGFEVHRMLGGGMFEKLGFVEGAGTVSTPQTYRFRTDDLPNGTHQFRLKQVDVDGSSEYSKTKTVEITIDSKYELTAPSPNPSSGEAAVKLTVEQAQNVRVEVFDLLGRRVSVVFDGQMGAQKEQRFRVGDDLSAGTYFVKVTGEGFEKSQKFVVVR
ncbi:FG-GAP-like repeat-containing protein [Longibacter salinarum]|nr:FG-GAP-like repeat-containing protein [Longibacter salinarum]